MTHKSQLQHPIMCENNVIFYEGWNNVENVMQMKKLYMEGLVKDVINFPIYINYIELDKKGQGII